MGKYLITGITGFAGPHLAKLLHSHGHSVYGLVRGSNGMETDILDIVSPSVFDDFKFVYGNLRDKASIDRVFKSEKFDGVFHLAAQSHPPTSFLDPIGTYKDNVVGSVNLIESVIENNPNCKFMFCSTSEVYGNEGKDGHLIKETDQILPSNPYGNSKASIDLYLQERFTNKKINGFITRAFSHTGPRRGKTFSISSDAYQIARLPKSGGVLRVGNLSTTRVVMDVRDTVNAYYTLMMTDKSNGQIYNVCGDTPRKMQFFTDKLLEIAGVSADLVIDPKLYRPIDIMYQHGDSSKIKELGWKENYTIEKTLSDLLNYWRLKHGSN